MDLIEENPEIWTAEFKEELRDTDEGGVALEKKFIEDCLPVNAVGLSAEEFDQYIDYIADRRLEGVGLKPLNPGRPESLPLAGRNDGHQEGAELLRRAASPNTRRPPRSASSTTTNSELSRTRQHNSLPNHKDPTPCTHVPFYILIEKTLIEQDAPDVAKSLLLLRNSNRASETPTLPLTVKVIRRNNKIAPWDSTKVEIAVRKAFLTLGQDSEPAVQVADAVATHVLGLQVSRIHIEDVQDIVQEELMRLGHFKVAEAYILYRAHRRSLRENEGLEQPEDERQSSMIMVTLPDGTNEFWDGTDLKRRIEFASIGLDLNLTEDEIEAELRRSVYSEMSLSDLRKTVILNAKALIELDADFSRFAGRILLTFIYEEVLDWDIVKDGIGKLKEAHQKAFRKYLARGVEIKRLNPELLDRYDLDKLAEALDPGADMDFDYLGIQTLYDRYLIVDKMRKPSRRLEVPQFFWMRVSMGLFLREEVEAETWVASSSTAFTRAAVSAAAPRLFSMRAHCTASSPPATSTSVADSIESIMNAASRKMPTSPSGQAGSAAHGPQGPWYRFLHSGNQWREPGGHSLPQVAQRPVGRGQPGGQAPGLRLRLSRNLAQRPL
jgi:transcriptional regulator NrdR family protein